MLLDSGDLKILDLVFLGSGNSRVFLDSVDLPFLDSGDFTFLDLGDTSVPRLRRFTVP